MKQLIRAKFVLIPAVLAALILVTGAVFAHEGREVGEYRLTVGWTEEPAYEGMMNGVDVRVTRLVEDHGPEGDDNGDENRDGHDTDDADQEDHDADDRDGHDTDDDGQENDDDDRDAHDSDNDDQENRDGGDDDGDDLDGDDDHDDHDDRSILPLAAPKIMASGLPQNGDGHNEKPVNGLQDTLQVEVSHVASETSKVLNLRAVLNQPGDYTADLIPTAPGVYEFRVFGAVEGNQIDETFVSRGGGGDFDDIQTAAALQFPNQVTGPREIESAVRGALDTAQQAQDAARAAGDHDSGAVLGIIGIVLGAAGLAAGTAGLLVATRKRRPTAD